MIKKLYKIANYFSNNKHYFYVISLINKLLLVSKLTKKMKTKKLFLLLAAILSLSFVLSPDIFSQGPPPWAPAHGYRAKTRHIYFPDYNFYFDLRRNVYIYQSGNTWLVSVNLPSPFASVNLRTVHQVEMSLNTDSPQKYNAKHQKKYKVKSQSKQNKPQGQQNKSKDNPGKGPNKQK